MISDSVRFVLEDYCHEDTEPVRFNRLLHEPDPPEWVHRVHDDFAAAARAGELTPELMARLTNLEFDDQAAVDCYLSDAWQTWYPSEPYPAP